MTRGGPGVTESIPPASPERHIRGEAKVAEDSTMAEKGDPEMGMTAPTHGWRLTRPSLRKMILRADGPPRTEVELDIEEERVIRATLRV